MTESDIPTEPHHERPETVTVPSPPPVTLEAIWDKLSHLERKIELMSADVDVMFTFVRSSVRQIEDSDIIDRIAALERLASKDRAVKSNGNGAY